MNILVDDNIPRARELLEPFGDVTSFRGEDLRPGDSRLKRADVLIVRSVTRVDEKLLTGTRIRFVGSATAGTDHVDDAFLRRSGIAFAHAPGANANSVAEFVLCAMACTGTLRRVMTGEPIGIVGVGAVGGRLARKLLALGIEVQAFDPFVDVESRVPGLRAGSLQEVMCLPVCSFHVPLTSDEPWPTRGMLGADLLAWRPQGSVLINTSRGGTMVPADFYQWAASCRPHLILDVWPEEPLIREPLKRHMAGDSGSLGTPHIAGHSLEGKHNGVIQVVSSLARFLGIEDPQFDEPGEPCREPLMAPAMSSPIDALEDVLRQANDLRPLSDSLLGHEDDETKAARRFHQLRKCYPNPREFSGHRVVGAQGRLESWLQKLGFRVGDASS